MFKIFKIFNLFNLLNLLNLFTTASLHIKPTGRMFHNAVLNINKNKNHNKNEIWMLGGIQQPPGINRTCLEDCSGPISNGLWKYNIDENTWCYNNVSFPKRRGSSIISNNDFIYIQGGGITNTKNPFLSIPLSDMWRYDKSKTDTEGDGHGDSDGDTEMQWTQIKTNNPDIYLHESVITDDGQIYSLGGFDTNGHSPYLYIFDGKKWSREIAFPFSKNISETSSENSSGNSSGIWGHSMTLVDKRYIYVIGGTCGPPTETTSFNKDVWTYDILTKKWNLECGGIPIYGHRACHVERHLVTNNHLQGLQDPDNSVDYLYSENHISFPNDDIIITGGFYPTKNVKNNEGATHLDGTTKNIYCFNTRSRTWKYMGSMQKPREFHSAIFINDVIFVFGGYHIGYFWDNGEVIYLMKK